MADTPDEKEAEQSEIVAGSMVYFNEKSPHYLSPDNADPMSVQEIVSFGAAAVCTRNAELAGTWPVDELRLSTEEAQHVSGRFDEDDTPYDPPTRKKFR